MSLYKRVCLSVRNDRSDKIYIVIMEEGDPYPGGKYIVNGKAVPNLPNLPSPCYRAFAFYGRRTGKLKKVDIIGWNDLHTANIYFEEIINTKKRDGYTIGPVSVQRMDTANITKNLA